MSNASSSRLSLTLLSFVLCSFALACGGSSSSAGITNPPPSPPPVPSGSTTSLLVQNDHYSPVNDSVAVGATLTWTWDSCTGDGYGGTQCASHSVKFDDGPASSIQSSGTFTRQFATAGTYTYHCAVHGAAMSGKITVH